MASTSEPLRREPIALRDLFLRQEDVDEGMRSVVSVEESQPRHPHFVCFGGPGGTESAFAEWGDPDSREALWRVVDLRWMFDDDAAAEAFRAKTTAYFEGKQWRAGACPTMLGDACTRLIVGPERSDGEPHIEIALLFRVGSIVAEVTGGEGPRVGKQRLDDERLLPFARRAEARIREAVRASR